MKKWFPASIIIGFLLVILIACTSNQSPVTGTRKIRLVEVTHSLFYTPQYIAINKGFFKQQGLDIELINGNGGDKTMTTLLANQSDIVLVGTEGAIYVTAQNSTQPVIAFAQLTQTDGSFLISRKPIAHFTWDQLKGKKLLGQRRGGMPEMVSEFVQRKHGLKPHQDVQIIQNVDYKNLGTAFASGTGDFAQLFEPVASKLEREGKGYIVASFGKDSGRIPYTVYITKKSLLEKDPETVKRFVRAVHQAQLWIKTHSTKEIVDVIAPQFPDVEHEILARVIERYKNQQSWATDPIIDQREYEHLLDIMEQAGELPTRVPYQQIVNTEISQQAIHEARTKTQK